MGYVSMKMGRREGHVSDYEGRGVIQRRRLRHGIKM